jgi:hypothetical protein
MPTLTPVVTADPPRRPPREPSLSVPEAIDALLAALPLPDQSINGVARQLDIPPSTVLRWYKGATPQPRSRRDLAKLCRRYGIPFR